MGEPREPDPLPSVSGSLPHATPVKVDVEPDVPGYEVTGRLGRGGMGTVWRAVQKSTRRAVALKVLGQWAFDSDRARARFDREVELTARLEHPNIARVYESGVAGGLDYYAMELVEGVPLAQYVEQGGLTRREVLELMLPVCRAVQYAHQRGVIHRDLKPSNVVVTADGQPHVLDFGLARSLAQGEGDLAISVDGEVTGTPAYMSPEQAAGRAAHVDTRSDVYSLGVMLFRLLTGEPPHDLSGTRYEVLRRIAEDDVRRPSDLCRGVGRDLEALLLKALAHEPDERYASAGELAQDIENYLGGEPLKARRPTTAYFLAKRIRKYRGPVAAAAAVLAALIGLAVFAYVRIAQERNLAEAAADRERQARIELEAKGLQEQGKYAEAEKLYREIVESRTRTFGGDAPKTLAAMSELAVVLGQEARHAEAEKLGREVLAARSRVLGADHPDTITSLFNLAAALRGQNRYADAESLYRQVVDARRRVLGPDHRDTLAAMRSLAFVLRARGQYADAASLYQQVLDGTRRTLGPDNPRTLILMSNLARVLQQEGKAAESEKLFRDALDRMTAALGEEHPYTLFTIDSLVSVLKANGKDQEADQLVARQKEILEKLNREPRQATPLASPDEGP